MTEEGTLVVGQKVTAPSETTKLNGKSNFIGRPTALVHLGQVEFCESEVLAKRFVINLVRQTLRFFQPTAQTGSVIGSGRRIHRFPPLMARR